MLEVNKRLKHLIGLISNEQKILNLEKKIGQRVKTSMEKTQKEYYLREQLKAIQQELGDKEGKTGEIAQLDRKSTRLNSSHVAISYAVFCLKKKKIKRETKVI